MGCSGRSRIRTVIQPETATFGLLLRNLQPLTPPDPFDRLTFTTQPARCSIPCRSGFTLVSPTQIIPAICVETRHMHAVLSARINKTDRNDARGIAQMMRVGLFKAVHVKTPASQHRRFLLTSRKLLQKKIYDIENDLRGSLRNFGLKVGVVGAARFDHRVRELVADHPTVAAIADPLLEARAVLRAHSTSFTKCCCNSCGRTRSAGA